MRPIKSISLVISLALLTGICSAQQPAAKGALKRHRTVSHEWNDSPLMSARLLSAGSSVPSDGGNLTLSQRGDPGGPLILGVPMNSPDNWKGGTGSWSDGAFWDNGVPGASSDVTIYSGKDDVVTLDKGSATISSLTLGGIWPGNNTYSELTDGGVAQTLTITNALNVGESGYLVLTGGSTVNAGPDSSNAEQIFLMNGSSLTVNGDADNTGSIYLASSVHEGYFAVTGTLTNSGVLSLGGRDGIAAQNIINSGSIDLMDGPALTVTGDVNNSNHISASTCSSCQFSSFISISGMLTNSGSLTVYGGPGRHTSADIGSVFNTGSIDLSGEASLSVSGDMDNAGSVSVTGGGFGGSVGIGGKLTNSGSFTLGGNMGYLYGDMATIGSVDNSGTIDLENASTITVNGDVTNSGTLSLSGKGGSGGNTLTIPGQIALTNNATGLFAMYGPGDTATIGIVNNNGTIDLRNGSTLEVLNDLSNNSGGALLLSGAGTKAVSDESVENGGTINLENGAAFTARDVTNSGTITTSFYGGSGGNHLDIVTSLTNNAGGMFTLYGPGDMASIGSLANNAWGLVDLEGGSTLQVNGGAINSGALGTNNFGYGGGNTLNVTGDFTNEAGAQFVLNGPHDMTTLGGLNNSGFVDVEGGSTLGIGAVNNSGIFLAGYNSAGGNTLSIGTLTNEPSGLFVLNGPGDVANVGDVQNGGDLIIGKGATFNLDNYSGVTVVDSGAIWQVFGTFTKLTDFGNSFAFEYLYRLDGIVDLENGQNLFMDPGIGTLRLGGALDVGNATNLEVFANVSNEGGTLSTGRFGTGGNTLAIDGDLHGYGTVDIGGAGDKLIVGGAVTLSDGTFQLLGSGSMASIGGLANSGIVDVENGSTLQVNGDATNSGTLLTNSYGLGAGGGNTLTITGTLTNSGFFDLGGPGDKATIGNGLTNNFGGTVGVDGGSQLTITGDVNNSGFMATDLSLTLGGGNKLTISGMLTNEATGAFVLYGPADVASIGNGVSNAGGLSVDGGSTLTITGNVDNTGRFLTSGYSSPSGSDTLMISGMLTNESGGMFVLYGTSDKAVIGNGLTNNGLVDVDGGSTLTITGDANNSNMLLTSYYNYCGTGGNTLNISGALTNQAGGQFVLNGPGDMATIGNGMNNAGTVDLDNGSALTINGDVTNSGTVIAHQNPFGNNGLAINGNLTNSGDFRTTSPGFPFGYANSVGITGMLTNSGSFFLGGPGDGASISGHVSNSGDFTLRGSSARLGSGLDNSGSVSLEDHGSHTGGATLQITGDVSNSGSISTLSSGDATFGNSLEISGKLTNQVGGTLVLNPSRFGPPDTADIGSVDNSGTIEVNDGSQLYVGDFNNSGILSTSGRNEIVKFGSYVDVGGMLTNTATGEIDLNGPGSVLQALGGLSNNGVINVNNGSSIDPPFVKNGGTINIDSLSKFVVGTGYPSGLGYIQLANGTLGEMISGLNSFGVINVNGSALLDGTLAILLQGGYNPVVGSEFKILTASPGQISGIFSTILDGVFNCNDKTCEYFYPNYDFTDGYVELVVKERRVPEPTTLLVLIPGLLGMGYGLRRRWLQ